MALVAHGQRGASLTTTRGDDGATGARTHAQPEAVDLRATPVVRLKRTLAHYWLQGRVRKVLRQTPRICGALLCMCRCRALMSDMSADRIIGISIKKIRPGRAVVKSDRPPDRSRVRRARPGRWRTPLRTAYPHPCGQPVVHRGRNFHSGACPVDNLNLWITLPSPRPQPPRSCGRALYTPSDLQIVDNPTECTVSCHPVDKPVHNLWTTL